MRNIGKRLTAILLTLLLIVGAAACGQTNGTSAQSLDQMITQTADALQDALQQEEGITTGSPTADWTALVCALAGKKDEKYLTELEKTMESQYSKRGYLSDVKATEYHRSALTVLALGKDPTNITGNGAQINLVADGTWNFPGGSPGLQGANGLIYALLLLDSKNYETPQADLRKQYIEELLTYQKDSGAFCIDNSLGGDVDITAMALQALAPYQEDASVKNTVEQALNWLSAQMTETAGFDNSGTVSAESSAQVVLALCALGTDPAEDAEFTKDGQNVLDGLNQYRRKDGMYVHESGDEKANIMATYQSLLALEAVQKQRTKQQWIFDFSDHGSAAEEQTEGN